MPTSPTAYLAAAARALRQRFTPRPVAAAAAVQLATAPARPLYREIALDAIWQWLGSLPDVDEVLRRTGRSRASLRELERDDEVTQALETRRDAVIATPWRLEPQSTRVCKAMLEIITPHMHALLRGCWSAVPYGYAVIEVIYEVRADGRIGIKSLAEKPFEWFRPLHDGSLRYFPRDGSGGTDGIECDPRKFILVRRNPTYRQPAGEPLLSRMYWPVTWRAQGWVAWLGFIESFAQPLIVGKTVNYQAFVDAMQAQGVRNVIGWQAAGPDEEVKAITQAHPGEFERLEERLIQRIQRTVLGQTLTSGIGSGGGSFAAAKVHDHVRDDKRRSDLHLVSHGVQQLVDALAGLNGWAAPKFCMQDEAGLEPARAERDAKLVSAGILRFTDQYLLDRYDFEEGDFVVPAAPAAPAAPGLPGLAVAPKLAAPGQGGATLGARKRAFTPVQEAIEDGLAELDPPDPIAPELVRAAVLAARDEQDLRERLSALVPQADPRFQQALERASYAAAVLGYVAADERRS